MNDVRNESASLRSPPRDLADLLAYDSSRLSPLQRAFVRAFVDAGDGNASAAARRAGYSPANPNSRRVVASQLRANPNIAAAIAAETAFAKALEKSQR